MFAAQFFPVLWLSIVQIATYNFLRGNIAGICTPDQPQGLTCPNAKTFFNASVIDSDDLKRMESQIGQAHNQKLLVRYCMYETNLFILAVISKVFSAIEYGDVRAVIFPAPISLMTEEM